MTIKLDINYAHKEAVRDAPHTRRARPPQARPGFNLKDARRRRRIPAEIAAARASISRTTLVKIEKGDPGVAVGSYAIVLFVLGMTDRLADLADPRNDAVGLQLEEEHLPQRISRPRKQ